MAEGYAAPEEFTYHLPGESARIAFEMAVDRFHRLGKATDYDHVVAGELARVLAGGDTNVTEDLSEGDILDPEREGFMRLVHSEGTMARVEHMLLTGKPLRN